MKDDSMFGECIWCGGADELVCVLCEHVIPCMFCGGTGQFTMELKGEQHVCAVTSTIRATITRRSVN